MMRGTCAILTGLFAFMVGIEHAQAGCERDTDCKGDRICEGGACVAPPAAATKCEKDTDCTGDLVCTGRVCVSSVPGTPAPPAATPTQPTTAPTTETPPPAPEPGSVPPIYQAITLNITSGGARYVGASWLVDKSIKSMSTESLILTYGINLAFLKYANDDYANDDADLTVTTYGWGVTLGARKAAGSLALVGRVGPLITGTTTEFMGSTSHDYGAVLSLSGGVALGSLYLGADIWVRSGSLMIFQGGYTW